MPLLSVLTRNLTGRISMKDLVPGQIVRVPWTSSMDEDSARLVHVLDGAVVSERPAPRPVGVLFRTIDVTVMPHDGRLRPGRHEFRIDDGRMSISAGGFHVSPFLFGC